MKKYWIVIVLLLILGISAYFFNQAELNRTPPGLIQANGRLQMERIDVAGLYPGRVQQVLVNEGDVVQPEQVLVKLSSDQYNSQLDASKAARSQAQEAVMQAEAQIKARQSKLKIAQLDLINAQKLRQDQLISASELQKRKNAAQAQQAAVQAAQAAKEQAKAAVAQAQAMTDAATSTTQELQIKAPVYGFIQYKYAQPGNVIAQGHPVVTLLNPAETSMYVYLPTATIGKIKLKDEARIVLDGIDAVWPAYVSQVSKQAQYTPKYVESNAEREKLMYRVKLQFTPELARLYSLLIKSGLTGQVWLRTDNQAWPTDLTVKLPSINASRATTTFTANTSPVKQETP